MGANHFLKNKTMEKINLQELKADKERLEQTINDLMSTFLKKHELSPREVVVTNPIPSYIPCAPDVCYRVNVRVEI